MGCCGGSRKRRAPAKAAKPARTERVLMEYTGPRMELFTTRGPATGVRYYTSTQEHERVIAVWREDAEALEASGAWRPVELAPEIETVGEAEPGEPGQPAGEAG